MIERLLATSWTDAWLVILSAIGMISATILYVRVSGLRSFSKMSSFDFIVTVAIGSSVGTVVMSREISLAHGAVGLAALFGTQFVIAILRRYAGFGRIVDNSPLVLMVGARMLEDNMREARVTPDDVRSKLREANVLNYDQVRAVILETTGDISVLHGDGDIDLDLVEGVRDGEALREA